jgi:ERCC4-related helicase
MQKHANSVQQQLKLMSKLCEILIRQFSINPLSRVIVFTNTRTITAGVATYLATHKSVPDVIRKMKPEYIMSAFKINT